MTIDDDDFVTGVFNDVFGENEPDIDQAAEDLDSIANEVFQLVSGAMKNIESNMSEGQRRMLNDAFIAGFALCVAGGKGPRDEMMSSFINAGIAIQALHRLLPDEDESLSTTIKHRAAAMALLEYLRTLKIFLDTDFNRDCKG